MLKKTLGYTTGLIALYLIVFNGSKSGQVIKEGAAGFSTVTKTLQGR